MRESPPQAAASPHRKPSALRHLALQHTQFGKATCGTIRLTLLKIGALVRTTVRRITFAMASSYPYQRDFAVAHAQLEHFPVA